MFCPVCNNKYEEKYKPFCSRLCSNIDLNEWLSGSYTFISEDEKGNEENLSEDNC